MKTKEAVKLITASKAETQCRSVQKKVMKAITAHVLGNPDAVIYVDSPDTCIQWPEGAIGGSVGIGKVYITSSETYITSDIGDTVRLEPSNLSTFDLIAILEAIEKTITVK